jgi:hypothetical protein
MKIKEFTAYHIAPEHAVKLLADRMNAFLKGDQSIEVISVSHSVIDIEGNKGDEKTMASALLCYK